jgi:DNA replication protein DnaC
MGEIQNCLKEIRGPFNINGDIKQGYLFEFNYEAAKVIRNIYGKPFPEPIERYFGEKREKENMVISEMNNEIDLLLKKKQIILYGPPGTGKTYKTKNLSVIING